MRAAPTPAADDGLRLDVWLWRARFFKSRALAARFLEEGRVRLTRAGGEPTRVDKPSRTVRPGDGVMFALAGRLVSVRIEALGNGRGSATQARALYSEAGH